jgi:hypothetical protein
MRPTSPQMSAAIRALCEWDCDFVRDPEDGSYRPSRYSAEPPRISRHTMRSLIARGRVRVLAATARGAAETVRLKS